MPCVTHVIPCLIAGSADGESEDDVRSMILFPTSEKAVAFHWPFGSRWFFSRRKLRFGRPLESVKTVAAVTWQTCKQLKVAHFCPFWLNGKKQKHQGPVWWIFFCFFLGIFPMYTEKGGNMMVQHLPLFLRILRADVELCSFSKVRSLILRVGSWEFPLLVVVKICPNQFLVPRDFFWTWRPRTSSTFQTWGTIGKKVGTDTQSERKVWPATHSWLVYCYGFGLQNVNVLQSDVECPTVSELLGSESCLIKNRIAAWC